MPGPEEGLNLDFHHYVELFILGVIAVVGFLLRHLLNGLENKIQELSEEKADNTAVVALQNTLTAHIEDTRDFRREMIDNGRQTQSKLDDILYQFINGKGKSP